MASSEITHLSYYVPETCLTNSELETQFGEERVRRLTNSSGIENRRVSKSLTSSDLGYEAAEKILSHYPALRSEVDGLILATQTPDYLMPTTACILQNRLNLSSNIAAFDINLGCSQFVYAHSVAHSMIAAGLRKCILVITCETPSQIIDPNDSSTVPLFGDGATAAIIQPTENHGYLDFTFGTDGSQYDALIWHGSGMKKDIVKPMVMDGQRIFLFTQKIVPKEIKNILELNDLKVDDVDFFALHQASGFIVNNIANRLKISETKFNRIYKDFGNSGGSTVGISLYHAFKNKQLNGASTVCMSAFGVGLSWANAIHVFKTPPLLA